nr:hypothetical protein [Photobacterium damselae]
MTVFSSEKLTKILIKSVGSDKNVFTTNPENKPAIIWKQPAHNTDKYLFLSSISTSLFIHVVADIAAKLEINTPNGAKKYLK